MLSNRPDIRTELGLRRVINVSGTMTSLGASIVVPEAVEAVSRILPEFVEISDLHRKASAVIAARLPPPRPARHRLGLGRDHASRSPAA